MLRIFISLLFIIIAGFAQADETYVCLYGGNERIIHVSYPISGSTVPCEVVYEKDTGRQVLWSAQNEEGYCETKAAAFVEKQKGWGWDCSKMTVAQEDQTGTSN